MARRTGIAWADATFNPWWGCTRVSPGCMNCYAERDAARLRGMEWGPGAPRVVTGDENWKGPLRWHREALQEGTTIRVFCGSMCDVFEEHPALELPRARLWDLIRNTTDRAMPGRLIWMLLTKRPENVLPMLAPDLVGRRDVWLGFSAEDQLRFGARWMEARAWAQLVPVVFVSLEPLIGKVVLPSDYLALGARAWVIVGGESAQSPRYTSPEWARALRDQCTEAGVPFFFKQHTRRPAEKPNDVLFGLASDRARWHQVPGGET